MSRPISALVRAAALTHNLEAVRRALAPVAGAAPIWAVVKANAYGHGLLLAVQAFAQADGLAMLDLDEAVRCREAGWRKPLLLLEGAFEPSELPVMAHYGISTVLHNDEQLDMLAVTPMPAPLDAWLKLDTGMHRLGFSPGAFGRAQARADLLQRQHRLGRLGYMTHFATADGPAGVTHAWQCFQRTVAALPPAPVSLCNSAASLRHGEVARPLQGQPNWVRPGICLYGASPFEDVSARELGLRPAMSLCSRLIAVRTIEAGEAVGYGAQFRATRAMRIGVVACGYADGYPRHAPTGTPLLVDGVRTRVLGRVSMDMLVADLDPVPQAQVGTRVVLWGDDGLSVDEVAQAAGTIGYELLCALAPRVPLAVAPAA